jgi:hypothetical protein
MVTTPLASLPKNHFHVMEDCPKSIFLWWRTTQNPLVSEAPLHKSKVAQSASIPYCLSLKQISVSTNWKENENKEKKQESPMPTYKNSKIPNPNYSANPARVNRDNQSCLCEHTASCCEVKLLKLDCTTQVATLWGGLDCRYAKKTNVRICNGRHLLEL